MSEHEFIDWLKQRLTTHSANHRLALGPGDDAALAHANGQILLAADMIMDKVHFDLSRDSPELAGRKALAVNLSDIAAMAGRPDSALVSLALPRSRGSALGQGVMQGILQLAEQYDVAIAGGDTNSWEGPLAIAVSVTGTPHPLGSVTRSGARVGDLVLVTGELGGSIQGRHLSFAPRIREAELLHHRYRLSAMLDLSDGLATDLRHILKASHVGARLDKTAIPVSAIAKQSDDPLSAALQDGEDFELCFTASPDAAATMLREQPLAPALLITKIGVICEDPELRWNDGSTIALGGYRHQFG